MTDLWMGSGFFVVVGITTLFFFSFTRAIVSACSSDAQMYTINPMNDRIFHSSLVLIIVASTLQLTPSIFGAHYFNLAACRITVILSTVGWWGLVGCVLWAFLLSRMSDAYYQKYAEQIQIAYIFFCLVFHGGITLLSLSYAYSSLTSSAYFQHMYACHWIMGHTNVALVLSAALFGVLVCCRGTVLILEQHMTSVSADIPAAPSTQTVLSDTKSMHSQGRQISTWGFQVCVFFFVLCIGLLPFPAQEEYDVVAFSFTLSCLLLAIGYKLQLRNTPHSYAPLTKFGMPPY